jgi:allophanate hydrolase
VPSAVLADNTPIGVTFLGRAGDDARLASIGAAYHAATGLPLGALGTGTAPAAISAEAPRNNEVAVAVAGAHLSGMPLNGELVALGARFLEATETSADYRLFALTKAAPPKGAVLRVKDGQGGAIAIELWALPVEAFGRLVAGVPPPLSIGTVRLKDGRAVKGFLAEPEGVAGARDVTDLGGWKAAFTALSRGA